MMLLPKATCNHPCQKLILTTVYLFGAASASSLTCFAWPAELTRG